MDKSNSQKQTSKYIQQEFNISLENKDDEPLKKIVRQFKKTKFLPLEPRNYFIHNHKDLINPNELILLLEEDAKVIISATKWSLKPKSSPTSEIGKPYKWLLHFWELFPFILSSKTKREVYEPTYNDLLADYLKALPFKTRWAKRWLAFSFTCRTAFMVLDCLRVFLESKVMRFAGSALGHFWHK